MGFKIPGIQKLGGVIIFSMVVFPVIECNQQAAFSNRVYRSASSGPTTLRGGGHKNLIILGGAPGVGKGTVSEYFAKHNYAHLSTGNMVRDAIRMKTNNGIKALKYVEKGHLVPDYIIGELVAAEILRLIKDPSTKGIVCDGYPRTAEQAKSFLSIVKSNGARLVGMIILSAPEEELLKRISGRRIHPGSNRCYNIYSKPPIISDIDDDTGEPLIRRKDDAPEAVKARLKEYYIVEAPLVNEIQKACQVVRVDADKDPETVAQTVIDSFVKLVHSM